MFYTCGRSPECFDRSTYHTGELPGRPFAAAAGERVTGSPSLDNRQPGRYHRASRGAGPDVGLRHVRHCQVMEWQPEYMRCSETLYMIG
jgi:hypothetical protein